MPAMEANIEGLWIAKQTARGTPATAPAPAGQGKRLRKVGGGLSPNPDHGSENYSDGKRFTGATDFINLISGQGAPVVQGGPGDLAYLAYLISGGESADVPVASVTPHTITPAETGSFWFTAWKRLGTNVSTKQKFNDCRMTSLRIEASSANKVVKATPTLISLDAGEIFDTDPTKTVDVDLPFLYTDAVGTFVLDGQPAIRGHSSFAFVISDGLAGWQGDSVFHHELVSGTSTIAVEGITLLVDAPGLAQYNRIVYGSAAPVAGTKPQNQVYYGSYTFTLTRGAGATLRSFQVTLPKVHWNPDVALEGNPDGGPIEISLGAEARDDGTNPLYTIVANTLDAAYT